jgi:RNA polymerase sigma-70 factor, ECF subfamily
MQTATTLPAGLRSESVAERNRAWRQLYDEQFDGVYRFVCRCGVSDADAEDVTQRVFVIVHRRVDDLVAIENVGGWVRGVALRVVAEHHRWRRVRRLKAWFVNEAATPEAPDAGPENATESEEARERVAEVLSRMSAKLRDVLVLVDLEGLGLNEAAETLGVPVNTVRSRRRLAQEDFRRRWAHAVTTTGGPND